MDKVMIQAKEIGVTVKAMFNPKELSIEKSVSWTPKEGSQSDEPPAEFSKPTPANLSVTLYFDTYEEGGDVYAKYVHDLELLAMVIKDKKRPPHCLFVWGKQIFQGVITSLTQKYTMFLSDGTRVRCECAVKMMAASSAETGSKKGGSS